MAQQLVLEIPSNGGMSKKMKFLILLIIVGVGYYVYHLATTAAAPSAATTTPEKPTTITCAGPTGAYTFTSGNTLNKGSVLSQCQGIKNDAFQAVMQSDGNFVVYNTKSGSIIWSTSSSGGKQPYNFNYQADGNLC